LSTDNSCVNYYIGVIAEQLQARHVESATLWRIRTSSRGHYRFWSIWNSLQGIYTSITFFL